MRPGLLARSLRLCTPSARSAFDLCQHCVPSGSMGSNLGGAWFLRKCRFRFGSPHALGVACLTGGRSLSGLRLKVRVRCGRARLRAGLSD